MKIVLDENILTKFIAGDCSEDERIMIKNILDSDPKAKARFDELNKVWIASEKKRIYQNPEEAWNKFTSKAQLEKTVFRKKSTPIITQFIRYAAVILLLILPLIYIYNDSEMVYKNIEVKFGERKKITLSDGTLITMDSGSKLSFPEQFSDSREVYLNGEAFFEVTRNKEKPFIVYANQGKIEVLGTKFNIRSWENINKVHLAVTEGKVSFQNNYNDTDIVFLKKGQFSVIDSTLSPTQPSKISEDEVFGWMNNEKYFVDTPLIEVLAQLERWYNIDIKLKNKSALNQILSIHIKNAGYKANLELITLVTGLNVEYKDGKIILN